MVGFNEVETRELVGKEEGGMVAGVPPGFVAVVEQDVMVIVLLERF